MITSNSRYANNPVVLLSTRRGNIVTIAPKAKEPQRIEYTFIRVEEGARVDHLAVAAFGDETQWWRIADANPEIIDWTNVPAGTVLRIPRG